MTARTYSEQLIAEWLELDGWYVKTGVPLFTSQRSRGEADIIGVKQVKGQLKVMHIEIGHVGESAVKDLKMVQGKTSDEIQSAIIKDVKESMGLDPVYEYRYIAMVPAPKSYRVISDAGLRIDLFNDVVNNEIIPSIRTWVHDNHTKKGSQPTPPSNLWMIQLLYRLMYYGVHLEPFYDFKISSSTNKK